MKQGLSALGLGLAASMLMLAGSARFGAAQNPQAGAGIPAARSAPHNGDQVLEIGPGPASAVPPPPAAPPAAPETAAPDDATRDQTYQAAQPEAPASGALPYLGIAVNAVTMRFTSGEQHGLEVVGVDQGSPAAAAGIKAGGAPTKLGASGATAGALLGPAEFVMVPLLRKTGQLGEQGDLIVAADDNRVQSENDLANELGKLKPGDTLWLTVLRGSPESPKSVKVPVRVGAPRAPTQGP